MGGCSSPLSQPIAVQQLQEFIAEPRFLQTNVVTYLLIIDQPEENLDPKSVFDELLSVSRRNICTVGKSIIQ